MNKKGLSVFGIVIIVVFTLFGIFSYYYWTSPSLQLVDMGSHEFCVRQGYVSVAFNGEHTDYFGKTKCVSCYNMECEYKEFNTTRNSRGIVKKDDAILGADE
jgi:hypothetical protein